jgi:ERCC4-type nuclease
MKQDNGRYLVLKDTREKVGHGWHFPKTEMCAGQSQVCLKTGDYTLKGLENIICIERKESPSELIMNLTEERFKRELDRLELVQFPFVLCEFTMDDFLKFPVGSSLPKRKWKYIKIKGAVALKLLLELQMQYKAKFIFCGVYGKSVAASIFKRAVEYVDGEEEKIQEEAN